MHPKFGHWLGKQTYTYYGSWAVVDEQYGEYCWHDIVRYELFGFI